MRHVSISDPTFAYDPDDAEGFRSGMFRLGPDLGARQTGATVYELPPGEAVCPYHYEYGEEEWALVLAGNPSVRTPEGTERLEPLDLAFFPMGPEGAHQILNETNEPVRGGHVVYGRHPHGDRISGQRQGRDLDRRQGRGPDRAAVQRSGVFRRRAMSFAVRPGHLGTMQEQSTEGK